MIDACLRSSFIRGIMLLHPNLLKLLKTAMWQVRGELCASHIAIWSKFWSKFGNFSKFGWKTVTPPMVMEVKEY